MIIHLDIICILLAITFTTVLTCTELVATVQKLFDCLHDSEFRSSDIEIVTQGDCTETLLQMLSWRLHTVKTMSENNNWTQKRNHDRLPLRFIDATMVSLEDILQKSANVSKMYVICAECENTTKVLEDLTRSWRIYKSPSIFLISSPMQMILEIYSLKNKSFTSSVSSINLMPLCDQFTLTLEMSNNRVDFKGITINAAAGMDGEVTELEHLVKITSSQNVSFVGGIAVNFLRDLEDTLNFRTKEFIGEWIRMHPNNETLKGNSSIRLMNLELDLQISHTTMLVYRAKYLDFLQPTMDDWLSVFFVQPPISSFRDLYTYPFSTDVWMSIFVMVILLSFSFLIISRVVEQYLHVDENNGDTEPAWLWIFSAVLSQSWSIKTESISLRILMLVAMMTGLVCYIAYSSTIVSMLSVETASITSFSSLLRTNWPIYGNNASSTIVLIIKQLQNDTKSPNIGSLTNFSMAIEHLGKNSTFPFIDLSQQFYRGLGLSCPTIEPQQLCSLSALPVHNAPMPSAMVLPKQSPFKEFWNYRIAWLKQIGLNYRYLRAFRRNFTVVCSKQLRQNRGKLELHDVFSAYLVIFFGYTTSLLVLVVELVFTYGHKFNEKKATPSFKYIRELISPISVRFSKHHQQQMSLQTSIRFKRLNLSKSKSSEPENCMVS